jgi:hypothetical protein
LCRVATDPALSCRVIHPRRIRLRPIGQSSSAFVRRRPLTIMSYARHRRSRDKTRREIRATVAVLRGTLADARYLADHCRYLRDLLCRF